MKICAGGTACTSYLRSTQCKLGVAIKNRKKLNSLRVKAFSSFRLSFKVISKIPKRKQGLAVYETALTCLQKKNFVFFEMDSQSLRSTISQLLLKLAQLYSLVFEISLPFCCALLIAAEASRAKVKRNFKEIN